MDKIPTGDSGLDPFLGGGVPPGFIYLLTRWQDSQMVFPNAHPLIIQRLRKQEGEHKLLWLLDCRSSYIPVQNEILSFRESHPDVAIVLQSTENTQDDQQWCVLADLVLGIRKGRWFIVKSRFDNLIAPSEPLLPPATENMNADRVIAALEQHPDLMRDVYTKLHLRFGHAKMHV